MALFERIFAPYMANPEAVVIQPGAAVELGPRTIMSLSLVLHELATNAANYGALSVSGGRVQVSWQVEEANGTLRLHSAESGGPPGTPPAPTRHRPRLQPNPTPYTNRKNLGYGR